MEPPKKVKYIQKPLFESKPFKPFFEKEKEEPKKVKYVQKVEDKTRVINVKVQFLRKMGYNNLEEWLQDPSHVYIGRHNHYVAGAVGSPWANPFKVSQYGRDGCIQKYKEHILATPRLMEEVKSLRGKELGCWCAPQNCHGHVLAQLADSL